MFEMKNIYLFGSETENWSNIHTLYALSFSPKMGKRPNRR